MTVTIYDGGRSADTDIEKKLDTHTTRQTGSHSRAEQQRHNISRFFFQLSLRDTHIHTLIASHMDVEFSCDIFWHFGEGDQK